MTNSEARKRTGEALARMREARTGEGAASRHPLVNGEPAADRLMRSLDYRLAPDVPHLTRAQVAVVLHALADHTAIQSALIHRRQEDGLWPVASSLGRWFHDTADQLEQDR